jgi:hypothetical protein
MNLKSCIELRDFRIPQSTIDENCKSGEQKPEHEG